MYHFLNISKGNPSFLELLLHMSPISEPSGHYALLSIVKSLYELKETKKLEQIFEKTLKLLN